MITESIDTSVLSSALDTVESAVASQGGWMSVARRVRSSLGDIGKRLKESLIDSKDDDSSEEANERQDDHAASPSTSSSSDVMIFYVENNASSDAKLNKTNWMIEIVSTVESTKKFPTALIPMDAIKSCHEYRDAQTIDSRLKKYSHLKVTQITSDQMKNISKQCEDFASLSIESLSSSSETRGVNASQTSIASTNNNSTQDEVTGDETQGKKKESDKSEEDESNLFKGVAIFPGTKWCGAGDVAANYDDLGTDKNTDMCCREHDHCPQSIKAGKSKYGLENKDTYTKSSCECDDAFYTCLQNVRSFLGDQVGRTYFNVLQSQCFKKDHPIVSCDDSKGFVFNTVRKACQSYQLDESQEKIYQFFDAKFYIGNHGPLLNIPGLSDNFDPVVRRVKNVTINGGIIGNIIG